MSEKKEKYYIGMGMKFVKEKCKEYKTLEGALKAAEKDDDLVIWDENGTMIGSLTNDVPEGVKVEGEEEQIGEPEEQIEEPEKGEEEEEQEWTGSFKVKVICDGSVRIRRTPSFEENNECGRASKGQMFDGKRIFTTEGYRMIETVDGLFLSAAEEHVKIIKN